ncbi:MAG: AAA family ATPase [Paracoccaceae bacterium]
MPQNMHLICGLPGAGKTTYAEQLRLDLKGVRFSIDEWNNRLFFMERKPTSDFNWFYERVQRCCAQMRETADHVIDAGSPAIFDCGFTNKNERQKFYDWADDHGYTVNLHFVDTDEQLRWNRVQSRNEDQGETYALEVTREMFDFMDSIREAPDTEELDRTNGQHIVN